MNMSEYSIARRYAQLLEAQQTRTLTDREAQVLAILRDCVERYEGAEMGMRPKKSQAMSDSNAG